MATLTLKLPTPPPFPKWAIFVENAGSGSLVVNPNGLTLDGSGSSLTLATNRGVGIFTDGLNYFTMRGIS